LGSDEKIDWGLEDGGLKIITPANPSDEMAVVFKIEIK